MSLSIASLTFLAYIYFPFSIDPKVLGWFHIMTLMTMLICSLAINLYSLVMNIKKTCCQWIDIYNLNTLKQTIITSIPSLN